MTDSGQDGGARRLASRLVIYIPTFENPDGALQQVIAIRRCETFASSWPWRSVDIVVSINGGDYDEGTLRAAGATHVRRRITNIGGDANIAMGLLEVDEDDLLWILSDNDPVKPQALTTISDAIRAHPNAGMVIAASREAFSGALLLSGSVLDYGGDLHVGLISGVIYRVRAIRDAIPFALQALWTGWTQIALQDCAIRQGTLTSAVCIPVTDLIEHSRGDQSDSSVARARAAYSHSYYGGALLTYMTQESEMARGRQALSTWWSRQWLYASAYRPPFHPLKSKRRTTSGGPIVNYRAGLVEAMLRTGNLRDRVLWAASWLPYWRVGLFLRKRGLRSRWWT